MNNNLTAEQEDVLDRLPSTRKHIADDIGISIRAVRYRMNALEEKGFEFTRDSDGVWEVTKHPSVKEREKEEPQRVSSYQRSQATKDIHDELTELEKDIKDILNTKPPVVSDFDNTDGKSTLVIPRSDDHFGADVEQRQGEDGFDSDVAENRVNSVFDHAINRAEERGDVENVVVGMFGDHVDGETVYNGQLGDIEKILREQIKHASLVYVNQIKKLAERFENVKVVTVPGNHGSLSKNGSTNADNILYDQLEVILSTIDYDNVSMVKSNNSNFVEFKIRDHQGYARHGQDSLGHLGTSSGKRRWYEWKETCNFDVAYHGHYHQYRQEPLGKGNVVFQCGTIVPPSLFADSTGNTGCPETFYHFATDEEPIDEIQPVRF